MAVAFLSAQRSKDPNSQVTSNSHIMCIRLDLYISSSPLCSSRYSIHGPLTVVPILTLKARGSTIYKTCVCQFGCVIQVGACIVNSERKIVGIGYNGMPNRCSDDDLPWQREADDKLDTKYPYGKPLIINALVIFKATVYLNY